ncbi:DUF4342 domain-containing protein [Clostridium lundense]|uniref:DUF4342 domain-containing protein n=1 Tax=Clostridium lundense TaxID=319475 RepID=UPI000489A68A|nr:DUF4342 domain-containing protein [Clostridium lundense]
MSEITLEKIDLIRKRTKVSYAEAKEALEISNGNVVDALIYIEENKKSSTDELYATKEEFIAWIKELIKKGNVTRIKVKKEDKVIADIPVNAGVAVTVVALFASPVIAIALFAAALTQVTVEITKADGTVEVVNKIIKTTVDDVKEKVQTTTSSVKEKFSSNKNVDTSEENTFTYTVNFDEEDKDEDKDKEKEENK